MTAISTVRESVVAIARIRLVKRETVKKGKIRPGKVNVGWGSGFCIAKDRLVATAYHALNDRKPPDPTDKHYVFVVPQNADPLFYFPVIGFPVLRPEFDLAVLQIGPCPTPGISIPALPLSFDQPADGSRVMTVGFPAPEIAAIGVDNDGNFQGGQFFLKSHANEGIVSAQYTLGNVQVYELNIGWHHGESGGPIVTLTDPPAAFSMMQQYRNVQSPHGTVAGPRRGCALSLIGSDLAGLGVMAADSQTVPP
jgi:Trypsin-like peptidase domain